VTEPLLQAGQAIASGVVYRRIPNWDDFYEYDEDRPTNQAFRLDTGDEYLSMYLNSLTTPEEVLAGPEHVGFGLCQFEVSDLLSHVAVWGITKGLRKKLTVRAVVLVRPTPRS
jgi:hypothetical protein